MTIEYQDRQNTAAIIFDIVYGQNAVDTNNAKQAEIMAWLETVGTEGKNIFTLSLQWKRIENNQEGVTQC